MTLEEELLALLLRFGEAGKIVTVQQRSLPPLAMGHYYTDIGVRQMRDGQNHMLFNFAEGYEFTNTVGQLRLDV